MKLVYVNRKLPNWQPSPQPDPDSDEEMEIAAIMREGATFQQNRNNIYIFEIIDAETLRPEH